MGFISVKEASEKWGIIRSPEAYLTFFVTY